MCRESRDGRLDGRANGSSEVAAAGKGAVVLGLEPKNPTGGRSFVCCCDAEGFVRGRTKTTTVKNRGKVEDRGQSEAASGRAICGYVCDINRGKSDYRTDLEESF